MQLCFQGSAEFLTTALVSAFPGPVEPSELVCDACRLSSAVLLQGGRPLSHYSRSVTAAEHNHIVTEKELPTSMDHLQI